VQKEYKIVYYAERFRLHVWNLPWRISEMQQKLEETLKELHEQLASTEDLATDQIAMLRVTLAEIQAKLDHKHSGPSSLSEQLTESIEQIQGSHPVLTNTIARVADLLAQMGI
jgi:small-conductance mechanosensitive channel